MGKLLTAAAAFLAGILFALLGAVIITPARAEEKIPSTSTPAPTSTRRATITPWPTSFKTPSTSTPTLEAAPTRTGLGWAGQVQCHNCTPFSARIRLSHYDPTRYSPEYPQLNCWDYSEEHSYCLSPTWIGVPWEAAWGWGAACPAIWAVGTWLEIPGVGMFVCLDQGGEITCDEQNLCRVDLMGPGGEEWDGKEFEVTLWVPPSFLIRLQED